MSVGMGRASRLIVWAAVVSALLAANAGGAAEPAGEIQVGIAGAYRTGSWTPLVVSGSMPAPIELRVAVEDPDEELVASPATSASGPRRFHVRFGRPSGNVRLESVAPDGQAASVRPSLHPPLPAGEIVLLVIGELPAAERAARLLAREDGSRPRVITVTTPAMIAAGAPGLTARDFDGVDAILCCGTSLAEAGGQDDTIMPSVLAGIDGWVRRGGRLIFIAGARGAEAASRDPTVAGWLPGPQGRPGKVERLVPLRRSSAIETFGRAGRPLDRAAVAGLQVPLLADAPKIDGAIVAYEGNAPADLPLVIRSAHGFGTITWIGIDIDQGAFRSWQGTDSLLVELLGRWLETSDSGRAGETRRERLDLAGQLGKAIDQYAGVRAIPFEIIAALGILYVACLYPLDWWLASRGGGRAWLAWLTLPLMVTVFSGLAWGTAGHWKGKDWQATAVDVTDIDAADGFVRGVSYRGIWSPDNATFDLSAAPAPTVALAHPDVAISWSCPAGRAIGGTDAPTAHPSLAAGAYAYGAGLDALDGVPIAASSSRLFEADWTATWTAAEASPPIISSLERDAQGTLRGTLESRLDFPLDACVLVHAGWLYDVGSLPSGGRYDPQSGRGPRSLAGALTRRAANKERDITARWDVETRDLARILEIAGFYAAAGGRTYTSLEAGRLGRLDLSPLLDLERAVLVGKGPPGTAWRQSSSHGTTREASASAAAAATSVWRIVLPLGASRP